MTSAGLWVVGCLVLADRHTRHVLEKRPDRLRSAAPGVLVLTLVMSALSGVIPRKMESAVPNRVRDAQVAANAPAKAAEPGVPVAGVKKQSVVPAAVVVPDLYANGTKAPIASVEWWERLAWCETASNWRDRGKWSGGLGIYTQTWEYWGGEEFAPVAWKATKDEQIVVANRIASQGWVREDGSMKDPIGYSGWGARRCAGSVEELSVSDERAYTDAQMAQTRTSHLLRVLRELG